MCGLLRISESKSVFILEHPAFNIFSLNLGVDYINGVCPCAGLSMLNTSRTSGISRGSDAEMNKWMFQSAEYVLGRIKPKAFWGENAPGLFTTIGEGVVDGLRLVILITLVEFSRKY